MKNIDAVDYVLAVGFLFTLITICTMSVLQTPVPPVLENVMWALAFGFGAKKLPQTI